MLPRLAPCHTNYRSLRYFHFDFTYYRVAWLFPAIPWMLAGIVIALAVYYDPSVPWMNTLNTITSNRLQYSHTAFFSEGLSVLGSPSFDGDSIDTIAVGYLDAGYLRLLKTHGLLLFVIAMTGLSVASYYAARNSNSFLLICLLCILLRSVIDGGFIYIQQSPILLLLLNREWTKHLVSDKRKRLFCPLFTIGGRRVVPQRMESLAQ